MARTNRRLIGHLSGRVGETPTTLSVYKDGRFYRLTSSTKDYLCHPSVDGISKLSGEAFMVFHLDDAEYTPI
jgi:hypothetical protein